MALGGEFSGLCLRLKDAQAEVNAALFEVQVSNLGVPAMAKLQEARAKAATIETEIDRVLQALLRAPQHDVPVAPLDSTE